MFSKTCEYAIRAMIFIANRSSNGTKTGIREIAEGINSPQHFIAKILQDLSRKGLVQSAKGPNGGFYLEPSSSDVSLADIVKAVDGEGLFYSCVLGLKNCSEENPCPLHWDFVQIRSEVHERLKATKVSAFSHLSDSQILTLKP